ncbi:NUDIX domain-containing protein [Flexivirga oryzae]|uniref:8-oxo-dGTP pyrophosphatase MutT (NUDIX family)/shikimate kinase n=1 Tax=Flexivirga oryzae TaxID=1794944 RepID=A0A839NHC2_9MICO|nr:8-oxo-dGTP pyrophosphatase MutT (NUDIX family)/shikimate kinase [Flexivirga oryzae]
MSRVLITGMSGAGKTTLLDELARRGHSTVDTDYDGWELADGTWDAPRMAGLLATHDTIAVSGTVRNQGDFYDRFEHVILLSAPVPVLLERVAIRTNNPYGNSAAERAEIAGYVETVEPLLRRTATLELDGRRGISELADMVEGLMREPVRTTIPAGFEALFGTTYVDYANADISGTFDTPPPELVHRIHLVASPAPGIVTVCGSIEGWRFLPGGRLEPGESLESAAARELYEEAGSRPTGPINVFFSHVAHSRNAAPYLPHVPHPVMWWAFAVVPTTVVGQPPAGVDGAEQITTVQHLPVAEAIDWLDVQDHTCAEVLRLAAHLELV